VTLIKTVKSYKLQKVFKNIQKLVCADNKLPTLKQSQYRSQVG